MFNELLSRKSGILCVEFPRTMLRFLADCDRLPQVNLKSAYFQHLLPNVKVGSNYSCSNDISITAAYAAKVLGYSSSIVVGMAVVLW
jgi:hypothetical protein